MNRDLILSIFFFFYPKHVVSYLILYLKHGKPSVRIFGLFITAFHVDFVPDSYGDTLAETTMASCRLPVEMTAHS